MMLGDFNVESEDKLNALCNRIKLVHFGIILLKAISKMQAEPDHWSIVNSFQLKQIQQVEC